MSEKSILSIAYDLLKRIGIYNSVMIVIVPILIVTIIYMSKPKYILDYPNVKSNPSCEASVCFKQTCKETDYQKIQNVNNALSIGEGQVSNAKFIYMSLILIVLFYIFLFATNMLIKI